MLEEFCCVLCCCVFSALEAHDCFFDFECDVGPSSLAREMVSDHMKISYREKKTFRARICTHSFIRGKKTKSKNIARSLKVKRALYSTKTASLSEKQKYGTNSRTISKDFFH